MTPAVTIMTVGSTMTMQAASKAKKSICASSCHGWPARADVMQMACPIRPKATSMRPDREFLRAPKIAAAAKASATTVTTETELPAIHALSGESGTMAQVPHAKALAAFSRVISRESRSSVVLSVMLLLRKVGRSKCRRAQARRHSIVVGTKRLDLLRPPKFP